MLNITLPDEVAKRLEDIARRENRPIVAVIESWIERDEAEVSSAPEAYDPIESIIGVFDDDIPDLSTTVRETLQKHFQEKYGNSD